MPPAAALAPVPDAAAGNDASPRHAHWRRFAGDPWAAFDALPAAIRTRLCAHAYEPWTVNAALLWRRLLRAHGSPVRAERAMLRALDHHERLERALLAAAWRDAHGTAYPHDAAGASVLRPSAPRPA